MRRVALPIIRHDELVAQVREALQFAHRGLERLDDNAAYWVDDADPFVSLKDKVVIEAALLVTVAARLPAADDLGADLRTVAADVRRLLLTPAHRALLMRYPHTAVAIGIGYLAQAATGARDPAWEEPIRAAFATGLVDGIERLPYRALEVRWLERRLSGSSTDDAGLVSCALAARPVHPIYMSAAETYALTHAVMYLTDFGDRDLPPGLAVAPLLDATGASLVWHLFTANFDLLGELVLLEASTGRGLSVPGRMALGLLLERKEEWGFLPSPGFDPLEYQGLEATAARSYAFRHTYHTNFVWGILCAVLAVVGALEQPTRRPQVVSPGEHREVAATCADVVKRAARSGWWEPDSIAESDEPPMASLARLRALAAERVGGVVVDRVERAAKAAGLGTPAWRSILCDALLTLAARRYDLSLLAWLIEGQSARPGPMTSTEVEALRFLARQQLPSGAIGSWFADPRNERADAARDINAAMVEALARAERRATRGAGRAAGAA